MNRRQVLALSLVIIIIVGSAVLLASGLIPLPNINFGTGASSTTRSSNQTISTRANTGTSSTTGTGQSIEGLQDALSGNEGLSNFISARECNLIHLGIIQFCDTFPDNSLDAKKWVSYGTITVTPGNVSFSNATMRTQMGFYYGHFGTFQVEITPQGSSPGVCPPWYVPWRSGGPMPYPINDWDPTSHFRFQGKYVNFNGQICVYDYAVFGFARGSSANAIMWGIYWEQNGSQIRTHTRYTDVAAHQQLDTVSTWADTPTGLTEYAVNWNVDSHGAYVDFYYKTHGGPVIYFSHHNTSISKTFLYLFAASNGTQFRLHRIVVLPAWTRGNIPLAALAIRLELIPD